MHSGISVNCILGLWVHLCALFLNTTTSTSHDWFSDCLLFQAEETVPRWARLQAGKALVLITRPTATNTKDGDSQKLSTNFTVSLWFLLGTVSQLYCFPMIFTGDHWVTNFTVSLWFLLGTVRQLYCSPIIVSPWFLLGTMNHKHYCFPTIFTGDCESQTLLFPHDFYWGLWVTNLTISPWFSHGTVSHKLDCFPMILTGDCESQTWLFPHDFHWGLSHKLDCFPMIFTGDCESQTPVIAWHWLG